MSKSVPTVGGRPDHLSLDELLLDWRNPRLPPDRQDPHASQLEIAKYIDLRYNPLEVANSIAKHGYFESEPLIVVRDKDGYIVVEGNRRLTALLGLARPEFRTAFSQQNRGWNRLPDTFSLPDLLPVVIVEDRTSVTPLLGFRHISGIKEWEPLAQARYISDLVDNEGYSLDDIAELVGRPHLEVKAMYRDHEIIRQAREEFGLYTARAEQDFGIFNAAMNIRNLRVYIDAPTPGQTSTDFWPLNEKDQEPLQKLLVYIYGDARGHGRVIPESRQLKDLGRVLRDPTGRAQRILDETHNLAEAIDNLTEPGELAEKRLNQALNALRRVAHEGAAHLAPGVGLPILELIEETLYEVRSRMPAGE